MQGRTQNILEGNESSVLAQRSPDSLDSSLETSCVNKAMSKKEGYTFRSTYFRTILTCTLADEKPTYAFFYFDPFAQIPLALFGFSLDSTSLPGGASLNPVSLFRLLTH